MKKIEADTLRRIIWQKHRVDGYTLFYELEKEKRYEIIAEVFEASTNYRHLPGKGLVEKKGKDAFPGYKDFSHLRSMEALAFDINQTNKASKDKVGRYRRSIYLKEKEAHEKYWQDRIADWSRAAHLEKWEPQNDQSIKRVKRFKQLIKERQNKEFDR